MTRPNAPAHPATPVHGAAVGRMGRPADPSSAGKALPSRPSLVESLPGSLDSVRQVIGLGATMELVRRFGGIRLFIPKHCGPDHPLAQIIGLPAATKLCRHFGGDTLAMPRAARNLRRLRNRQITRLYQEGVPVRKLARQYALTERQIYHILNQAGE